MDGWINGWMNGIKLRFLVYWVHRTMCGHSCTTDGWIDGYMLAGIKVQMENLHIIDLALGVISLLKGTTFCKVLKMVNNWAKLRQKFDKNS
jgi:hypothetical protein